MIFLHGFLGGARVGSFIGVKSHFEAKGCKVMLPEVSPINSVEFRGGQVAQITKSFLTTVGAQKVNIIAHSQGGLDARYAISKLGLSASVASLTMLSTPNRGTPVADLAASAAPDQISQMLLSALLNMMAGVSSTQAAGNNNAMAAIKSLSAGYMNDQFNPSVADAPGVYYQSWAARSGAGTSDRIKIILALTQGIITQKSGENDGVVPVSSAKWGEFRGVLEADHLDLLGLKLEDSKARPHDHIKFLKQVLTDLASKGY